jgi:hypothetical protein
MTVEIRGAKVLESVRGLPAADRDALAAAAVALGQIGLDHDDIQEIDINPLIIAGSLPIAVDALVILKSDDR